MQGLTNSFNNMAMRPKHSIFNAKIVEYDGRGEFAMLLSLLSSYLGALGVSALAFKSIGNSVWM